MTNPKIRMSRKTCSSFITEFGANALMWTEAYRQAIVIVFLKPALTRVAIHQELRQAKDIEAQLYLSQCATKDDSSSVGGHQALQLLHSCEATRWSSTSKFWMTTILLSLGWATGSTIRKRWPSVHPSAGSR